MPWIEVEKKHTQVPRDPHGGDYRSDTRGASDGRVHGADTTMVQRKGGGVTV
jgi:hypothetical protein